MTWYPLHQQARLLAAYLISMAGTACISDAVCEGHVQTATELASEHAQACTWSPDEIVEPDCSRTDIRPILAYYATWCREADTECVTADTDAIDACATGEPL